MTQPVPPLPQLLEQLAEPALRIAQRTEHLPMLFVFDRRGRPTPVGLKGAATSQALAGMARAACRQLRATVGVFINEGWAVRKDAPPDALQHVMAGELRVSQLDPAHRIETLILYGEDEDGRWAVRTYLIHARAPGGIVLDEVLDSTAPGAVEFETVFSGFIPRRRRQGRA